MKNAFSHTRGVSLLNDDALSLYEKWPTPVVIVSDGPYGVGGFKGDPPTPEGLTECYAPHVRKWTELSTPQTTLWFWNTEHGWANVHQLFASSGWDFVNCHIWNKGLGHVAGNANTKTLRKLPVVTEVCVQYVRRAEFRVDGRSVPMKDWLRHEWARTGIPFSKTNDACGVKDAATRKYFARCHLWYYPPADAFEKIVAYANHHGNADGKPYFSIDGKRPLSKIDWTVMRAKFACPFGVTNVWDAPPLNGTERLKNGNKALHLNQKPLKFMRLIIEASSDKNDVVWEPFGGLCSAAIACLDLGRKCYAAEIDERVFDIAVKRLKDEERQIKLGL